jgi:hypothetical protein
LGKVIKDETLNVSKYEPFYVSEVETEYRVGDVITIELENKYYKDTFQYEVVGWAGVEHRLLKDNKYEVRVYMIVKRQASGTTLQKMSLLARLIFLLTRKPRPNWPDVSNIEVPRSIKYMEKQKLIETPEEIKTCHCQKQSET